MIIKQLYMNNSLRNFNYIIACPETGEALVIDPLDAKRCITTAKEQGWSITQVLNTHEHWDHIGGNADVIAATQAKLLAHASAKDKIPNIDRGLHAGDIIKVGKTIELEVLDTPGHTFSHVCVLSHTETPSLFCGDTLFNAGAGNCHSGDPIALYRTFSEQLARLPDNTQVHPGHEYIINNLGFALTREPRNQAAQKLLKEIDVGENYCDIVTTLSIEKTINPFLRLNSDELLETLRESFPQLPAKPSTQEIFVCLRELRNHW